MYLQGKTLKKIRGLIVFTIFILVLLWNYSAVFAVFRVLWRVLRPFVIGLGIAFVLNLPAQFLEKTLFRKLGRGRRHISIFFTIILAVAIVGTTAVFLIPQLGKTLAHLGKNINTFMPQLQRKLAESFRDEPQIAKWILELDLSWDTISEWVLEFMKSGTAEPLPTAIKTVKSIINGATGFLISFVFACYVLLQKERLSRQAKKTMYAFLPRDWTEILIAFCSLSNEIFSKFLSGQCLEAVILGGMFFVALLLFQIPYALLISAVIAITALIPIFGAFIGCAVGVLLVITASPIKALLFVVIFFALQQVEGDLIYPHVVGRSVGLPPIWVLFSVTVGAGLMGIVGMIIFIPIAAVFYSMFKGIVHRRLQRRGITVEENAYIGDK